MTRQDVPAESLAATFVQVRGGFVVLAVTPWDARRGRSSPPSDTKEGVGQTACGSSFRGRLLDGLLTRVGFLGPPPRGMESTSDSVGSLTSAWLFRSAAGTHHSQPGLPLLGDGEALREGRPERHG